MKEKTISYSRVLEILSDAQLKNVLGGCGGSGSGGNGSGGASALCFECSNGLEGKCTRGDCNGWLSENCPGGWTEWSC